MYIYGIIKTLHQYVSVIFHSYMAPHKAKLINTFSVFFLFVCLFHTSYFFPTLSFNFKLLIQPNLSKVSESTNSIEAQSILLLSITVLN